MAHDVFLSYSSADKRWADTICAALEARGVKCWIAPRDVPLGADYARAIVEAIYVARALILVVSSSSNSSAHVPRELERAVAKNIPVVPFKIENVALSPTLEYFISSNQWLDAPTGRIETHLEDLGAAV